MVTEHFGQGYNISIFKPDNNKIVKSETIPNPGHKIGYLPNFLNEMGVNVIISGGTGGGAIDIFNEKGIEVVIGLVAQQRQPLRSICKEISSPRVPYAMNICMK